MGYSTALDQLPSQALGVCGNRLALEKVPDQSLTSRQKARSGSEVKTVRDKCEGAEEEEEEEEGEGEEEEGEEEEEEERIVDKTKQHSGVEQLTASTVSR